MKRYATNLIYKKYNKPICISANNVKELKDIIKQINSKFNKNEPKIELVLKNKDLFEINTQKTLKLYASKEA